MGLGAASIASSRPRAGAFARLHLLKLLQQPSDVLMVTWCEAGDPQTTETLITTGCFQVHSSEKSQGRDRKLKHQERQLHSASRSTSRLTLALLLSRLSHGEGSRKRSSLAGVIRREGGAPDRQWLCSLPLSAIPVVFITPFQMI